MAHYYVSSVVQQTAADAKAGLLNGKAVRIYSGTEPLSAKAPLNQNNVNLAKCMLGNPACELSDSNGILVFKPITPDLNCLASGIIVFARIEDDLTGQCYSQFDCNTAGAVLIFNTTAATQNGQISILSFQIQLPDGT